MKALLIYIFSNFFVDDSSSLWGRGSVSAQVHTEPHSWQNLTPKLCGFPTASLQQKSQFLLCFGFCSIIDWCT